MHPAPTCPRCGDEVRAPGLWSSAWQCALHGSVAPYTVLSHTGPDAMDHVAQRANVPLWLAFGLPPGWVCSGFAYAGDERTGARATVTAMSGPSPVGGPAELLVIAEEPGVGLGARHAGLSEPDPGEGFGRGAADAKVVAASHPTALWSVPLAPDRAGFLGEAQAAWLWMLVWPATAGVLMYDEIHLTDLRDRTGAREVGFGSISPRLSQVPARLGA
ncbi:MAG TPA: DUF6758 family protein [Mycobacteriales bacterium]|nr:DUF6758 family protein [Mycobacteriales bacterium]